MASVIPALAGMRYLVVVRLRIGKPYFVSFVRPDMAWTFIRKASETPNVVSCVLRLLID